jgi:hypothetical protein
MINFIVLFHVDWRHFRLLDGICHLFARDFADVDQGNEKGADQKEKNRCGFSLSGDEVVPANLGKQGFTHDRARVALDESLEVGAETCTITCRPCSR